MDCRRTFLVNINVICMFQSSDTGQPSVQDHSSVTRLKQFVYECHMYNTTEF